MVFVMRKELDMKRGGCISDETVVKRANAAMGMHFCYLFYVDLLSEILYI